MRRTWLCALATVLLLVSACTQAPPRASRPAFKGIELYSWLDESTGACRHSLLPGTNRTKSVSEIRGASLAIPDVATLRDRLGLLAKGEHVSWMGERQGDRPACPSREVIDGVARFAADRDVTVVVPR